MEGLKVSQYLPKSSLPKQIQKQTLLNFHYNLHHYYLDPYQQMADIVLSPLLQVIFDRISSPVLQKLGDIWDLKDNLEKLQQSLLMVQAVLEDAEEQQITTKAVKIWLSKLKVAVYDAEDILDEFSAKCTAFCSRRSGASVSAEKVRKKLQVLEMTAIEGLSLNLREGRPVYRTYDRRETGSFVVESEVYGREEDKEKIVQLLVSSEANQEGNLAVIPIIGIGGVGKTTLAQLAYNDERVRQHFDVKVWVFVSQNFDAKRIMRVIIESASGDRCKFTEIDALQSRLWGLLCKKRYLVVLDDVWSEDQDDWEKLRPLFTGGIVGSKVIVTTRSEKVAMVMDSPSFPFKLESLAEDDCWTLFRQRAFWKGEEEKYQNLMPIAKQIVKKCGGLPLAAKSMASLMRFKREEREWLSVKNSELWTSNADGGFLPSLMLSYSYLPSHLKRCFAFCSIFPKNYVINKEKLIHLWMAAGFIRVEGNRQPEDIGSEYFNDLLWMGFFQDVEKCFDGSITGYKMHDIIHNLARNIAGEEFMILNDCNQPSSLAQTCHASVVCKYGSFEVPQSLYRAEHLRALLLMVGGDLQEVPCKLLSSFRYLRALDLSSSGLTQLHESIGGLFLLRYLDLSYTYIRFLPKTMSNLQLLQTLCLLGCCNLEELCDLGPMADLRHLIITGCEALTSAIHSIRTLHQLQTLPIFIVDKCLPELSLLGHLDLCGELNIKCLQNILYANEAQSANLWMKRNLRSLGLYWEENDAHLQRRIVTVNTPGLRKHRLLRRSKQPVNLVEDIVEALQPHRNLKQLHVEGYPGTRFPRWVLPNLVTVNFTNCRECECLPGLGNLPLLHTLSMQGMDSVKCISEEFYGEQISRPFPSLEELILGGFPNLEKWETANNGNAFPKLRKLVVNNCPNLIHMPSFQCLQHLELQDCNQRILFIENVTSLSTLTIEKISDLVSLSGTFLASNTLLTSLEIISCAKLHLLPPELGNLTALKSLTIRWCEELNSLPQSMHKLKALEFLEISECPNIFSMPDDGLRGLTSLRTLSIENCSNLISLSSSLEHLTLLEHLTIMYCPSLDSLPEGLQHLSNLQSLTILGCPQFSSLPEELKYVTTLCCLELHGCPGLTALPEWLGNFTLLRSLTISDCCNVRSLPESIKLLSALQYLSIQDCPVLEERSKQDSGEDWLIIAHIPYKHIGSPRSAKSIEVSSSSG